MIYSHDDNMEIYNAQECQRTGRVWVVGLSVSCFLNKYMSRIRIYICAYIRNMGIRIFFYIHGYLQVFIKENFNIK